MAVLSNIEPDAVQIAMILGLPRATTYDPLKLATTIKRGVPAASAGHVAKAIDPAGAHVSVTDLVAKSTLHRSRERQQPLSTDVSETLWQVARVFVEARRQYHDDAEALAFLMRPHQLLGGKRPFDLARETSAGAELVLDLLAEAEAGVAI